MLKQSNSNRSFLCSTSLQQTNRKQVRKCKSKFSYEVLEDRALLASYLPGEVLVQFEPNANSNQRDLARAIVAADLVEPIQTRAMISAGQGVMERIQVHPNISVEMAVDRLKTLPGVKFAEPNWIYTTAAVSNDTNYLNGQLWGMYSNDSPSAVGPSGTTNQFGSQAEKAWLANHVGSNNVYVGVIDEGIQITHPDLVNNIWVNPFDPTDGVDNDGNGRIDDTNGWDFVGNNRTVYDGTSDDHGTHVAGTIGAKGGNGIGVAGVNWNVKMISAKFLGSGGGSTSGAIQAVDYLTDLKIRHGINLVATSNSWGGGGFSQGLLDAITRGANQGILFVAAAGNSNRNNNTTASYPSNYSTTAGAGYDAVIAVASITSTGAKASSSSYGSTTVDLGAPGDSVNSTLPSNTYGTYSGTSMATPHVSGAIALYAASNPGRTAAQLRAHLLNNTTATTSLNGITVTGGRLDIAKMFATVTPSISINDNSAPENVADMIFTVNLSSASTSNVSVNYATTNGTARGVATVLGPAFGPSTDFFHTTGTLVFAPGETSKTIAVRLRNDSLVEGNENFFLNLSSPSGGTISDNQAIGTIIDDDPSSSPIRVDNPKRMDQFASELASWWFDYDRTQVDSLITGRKTRR